MRFDRRFLVGAAATGGALLLASPFAPALALARAPTDRRFVFIIQRGAADGLGIVAPTGDPAFSTWRGQLAEDFESGARLDATFTLHARMPAIAGLYASGQALFVHAVASPYRDRSHFDGQNMLHAVGADACRFRHGWLNRMRAMLSLDDAQAIAVMGATPAALRDAHAVAACGSVAMAMPMHTGALAADSGAATGALAAKLLAPVDGARIALIETDGWDTHYAQQASLARQLAGLDAMIGALKDGLGPLWGETVVLVATEFGRTVAVNDTGGTDHGTGGLAMLLGGGIEGGRVLADWPGLKPSALYEQRGLIPTTRLDGLIAGAVAEHFGVEPGYAMATMFPASTRTVALQGLVQTKVR